MGQDERGDTLSDKDMRVAFHFGDNPFAAELFARWFEAGGGRESYYEYMHAMEKLHPGRERVTGVPSRVGVLPDGYHINMICIRFDAVVKERVQEQE